MMRLRIVFGLGCALLLSLSGLAQGTGDGAVWEAGTYFTYDAVLTFQEGSVYRFPITVIVLGGDTHFGLESWDLAGIYESYGGSKIVSLLRMIGPTETYLRWPAILNFIPAATISSTSDLTRSAAAIPLSSAGLPIRIERAAEYTADPEGIDTSADAFPDAIPVRYTWEWMEKNAGRAFWSPELRWWVYAEGAEEGPGGSPIDTYTISLSSFGVFSQGEIIARLSAALSSMEASDPEGAERIGEFLKEEGLDIQ